MPADGRWDLTRRLKGKDSVCVALVIQHGKSMRRIILSPLASLPYFSTLSQKRQGLRGKKSLNTKCVF